MRFIRLSHDTTKGEERLLPGLMKWGLTPPMLGLTGWRTQMGPTNKGTRSLRSPMSPLHMTGSDRPSSGNRWAPHQFLKINVFQQKNPFQLGFVRQLTRILNAKRKVWIHRMVSSFMPIHSSSYIAYTLM